MIRSASVSSNLQSNRSPRLQRGGRGTATWVGAADHAAATQPRPVLFKERRRLSERRLHRAELSRPRGTGCPGVVSIDVLMVGHRVLIGVVAAVGWTRTLLDRRGHQRRMVIMVTVMIMMVPMHGRVRRARRDLDHLPTPQAAAELREDHEHEQGQPHHDWASIGSAADRPTRHAP